MTEITVAALQLPFAEDDEQGNIEAVAALVEQAAGEGAQIVLPPELFSGPYFCREEDEALFALARPTLEHPSVIAMRKLAQSLGVAIPTSFFERDGHHYYNTLAMIGPDGELMGTYRKSHIPDGPGYEEKFYFRPGNDGFKVWDVFGTTIGVGVCWDQWYPEAARLMALAGADLLLYPTAIGWDPADEPAEQQRQLDAWITIQRAHGVANGLPVLVANRTGFEQSPADDSGIQFWGNSFVCGPQGEYLAQADSDSEQILIAEVNLQRSESVRRIWPYLRDRRVDAYGDLTKRFRD